MIENYDISSGHFFKLKTAFIISFETITTKNGARDNTFTNYSTCKHNPTLLNFRVSLVLDYNFPRLSVFRAVFQPATDQSGCWQSVACRL